MPSSDQDVKRRDDEEGEEGANGHPADQHETDRVSRLRAGAGDENKRHVTGDGGDRGHQDRPQADPRRLGHRLDFVRPCC